MDAIKTDKSLTTASRLVLFQAAGGSLLLWLSQPPFAIWPLGFVALVPLLAIACTARRFVRRDYLLIWLAGSIYWAVSLQGLRHAHPAIYGGWIALSLYLGIYFAVFVLLLRSMLFRRVPIWISAPVAWVGLECLRNYLLTGLSAAMLGHTMADVPTMIQIADLFGSYGVSFVIVSVNVAALVVLQKSFGLGRSDGSQGGSDSEDCLALVYSHSSQWLSIVLAAILVTTTLAYGNFRMGQPLNGELATFALVQRNERVEFQQDRERENKMFLSYAQQTINTARSAKRAVDAVVWPESMFSGGLPWLIADENAEPPELFEMAPDEFQAYVAESRAFVIRRAGNIQQAAAPGGETEKPPHLVVGCGVVRYGQLAEAYSGVVHFPPIVSGSDQAVDWYGKTHLVMIGEYIPILSRTPGIRDFIKARGLGLSTGPGAKSFDVNGTLVAPNICIETAVERVTVNQVADLRAAAAMPHVIVTVTNDGWFDDTSVIDHHLRCAQLVAVGCRRPLLSAANNGPTAWIDSCGRIVQQLPRGSNGTLMATPLRDSRISLYVRIGDWPARILALVCVVFLMEAFLRRRKELAAASSMAE